MSDIDKMVWAAAYAAEFNRMRDFYASTPGSKRTIDDVDGFSCAEIADIALEQFKKAVEGPDKEYLLPVKEGWVGYSAREYEDLKKENPEILISYFRQEGLYEACLPSERYRSLGKMVPDKMDCLRRAIEIRNNEKQ